MSQKVALLLAKGFEEAEAIITLDILRRLEIELETLSCGSGLTVTSYHQVNMEADALLAERADTLYDAIILPGGLEGTQNLAADPRVIALIQRHDEAGRWVCALCSAGARVLAGNQLLRGRNYVCSGDLWRNYQDGLYQERSVVVDGNLITGKGLGVAFDFALTIAAKVTGNPRPAIEQAEHIYHPFSASSLADA